MLPEPGAVKTKTEDIVECVAENCPVVRFCVNCGMIDHVASQCVENPVSDDFAYSRWAETEATGMAARTVPLEDDRVLMLEPAEQPAFYTPLVITCGAKQVQTCFETTTFDLKGCTIISIHLMLSAEQQRRLTITLAKLRSELVILYKRTEGPRPKK